MIGTEISHYRVLKKLGAGGMGEVYLAEDTRLKRQVALKFLPKDMTADPEARARFEQEAQAAAALHHPNIVTIYEINEHEGQTFIAMEYVEGQTLKDRMADVSVGTGRDLSLQKQTIPISDAISIVVQIAAGLAAAHEKGIVHRDIKPQNILVDKDNHVKILDFGLAKLKGVSPLTKESSTLGTVAYMSPEQAMGKDVDQRTDIWSLGVMLYEMLAGRLPFRGDFDQAMIYSILNEEPEPVTECGKDIPPEMIPVLDKALAKDPDERYQHVDDLAVDLRRLKKGSQPKLAVDGKQVAKSKTKPVASAKRKFPNWTIVSALLVITAAIAGGYLLLKGKSHPPAIPAGKADAAREMKPAETEFKNSIAVLPFRDYRAQKEQDYFCYNITDAIVSRLVQIAELKVRPTSAVMRYKDTDKDPVEIGRELDVSHIISGTVQKEANRIRLSAQLIDARSGYQIWSEKYDEALNSGNLFAIQDKISQAIADKLKLKLSPKILQELIPYQSQNMEAYDFYMRGLYLINYRFIISTKKEDYESSIKMFKRAIALDPTYVLAYLGLAWAYRSYLDVTKKGTAEDYQKVLNYLETAYRVNPNLPIGQLGMSYVYFSRHDYDRWHEILKKFIDSAPNQLTVLHVTGLCYQDLGLYEQSEKFYLKNLELDPYFFSIDNLGDMYVRWGKLDKAQTCFSRLLDMAPNNILSLFNFVELYLAEKKPDLAEEYLVRAEKMDPNFPQLDYYRSLLWAAKGNRVKALAINQNPESEIYALLGMNEEAIKKITDKSKKDKESYLRLLHYPLYESLRSDPRFQKILQEQKAVYEERVKKYGDL